tara:strand:+ start:439 stop:645 length:207 start_codon:yes stop_codon:yes gene_type:complete
MYMPPHQAGALRFVAEKREKAGYSDWLIIAELRAALGGTSALRRFLKRLMDRINGWTRKAEKVPEDVL